MTVAEPGAVRVEARNGRGAATAPGCRLASVVAMALRWPRP
jgi:hypothetical protein